MEDARRPPDRWLPLIGIALILPALLICVPSIGSQGLAAGGDPPVLLFFVGQMWIPAAAGVLAVASSQRTSFLRATVVLAFVALLAIEYSLIAAMIRFGQS